MFNVGDIVRGTGYGHGFPYAVTTSHATMQVMSAEGENIVVKLIDHEGLTVGVGIDGREEIGHTYTVRAHYFTLVKKIIIDNRMVGHV